MSPDTVEDWESGQTRPSPWLLRVLAAYFLHGGRPTIGSQTLEAKKLPFSVCLKLFMGRHLKRKRQELGLTQRQLAERLKTTIWAVPGWEGHRYLQCCSPPNIAIEFIPNRCSGSLHEPLVSNQV
ncbi:MAG: helix-turn-helix transcriptional regulator [Planctomycetes bacterium]|nr:helix-turn-helix transcriptional regulator [Planctomycetota bacterium]